MQRASSDQRRTSPRQYVRRIGCWDSTRKVRCTRREREREQPKNDCAAEPSRSPSPHPRPHAGALLQIGISHAALDLILTRRASQTAHSAAHSAATCDQSESARSSRSDLRPSRSDLGDLRPSSHASPRSSHATGPGAVNQSEMRSRSEIASRPSRQSSSSMGDTPGDPISRQPSSSTRPDSRSATNNVSPGPNHAPTP